MPLPAVRFDNSYARELPGFYVAWKPDPVPAPRLLYLNVPLAEELGLDATGLAGPEGAALFAGNLLPEGAEPIAQAYAGHQFGGFSPQLGDGRALLLGEIVDRHGHRRDLAFKGSGRTPFSRGGDGKAAIGPMLREVLISEAMHALGIPTTRALAVAATGEQVFREQALPGAVLTRVAASHIRVGTFQFFAARGEHDHVRRLAEYAIARHDPALAGAPDRFLALLDAVVHRQASLVAQWMNVGFIHGVMNTDNMTLSGETIDYGPCAFLEAYDPGTVFSSIDHEGRYAFGRQPQIAHWNLARFAECLVPLIDDEQEHAVARANEVLGRFPALHRAGLLQGQRAKLGLRATDPPDPAQDADDAALADDWLALLQRESVDFTLAWRHLADAAEGRDGVLRALFADPQAPQAWLARWRARCGHEHVQAGNRAEAMRRASPRIIPRHHRVEAALDAASETGDLVPFRRLLDALRRPFDDDPSLDEFAQPAPRELTAAYRTFCGT
ncbi:MAG: YdiU family protein [Lautropia sp.]|nr:MAG: YdiU family protein [Pseudomonadota bacterium]MBC6960748.1 YdiU family protein [Lautropia sp.]MCL4700655.1 YdiU family protein [Burkholderiaceae bacterium]MDL1908606.1 YdiU family protein [Betaproteobacteria bacterium PRO1]RIK87995.1 MAG: YdiU family protein [Burkholderiales bacterium]